MGVIVGSNAVLGDDDRDLPDLRLDILSWDLDITLGKPQSSPQQQQSQCGFSSFMPTTELLTCTVCGVLT
ncbi:hypothetical protein BVC93_12470 [Mycobacterium sp. MS1601]|nr:hypothetical protein BVC93_12470 [Mycobacterium sp. MS1601]